MDKITDPKSDLKPNPKPNTRPDPIFLLAPFITNDEDISNQWDLEDREWEYLNYSYIE